MMPKHAPIEAFGPDKILVGFWMLLTGIPCFIMTYDIAKFGPRADLVGALLLAAIVPSAILVFTMRFRATFSDTTFSYRRWGRTFVVPRVDIDHILVTNRTAISKEPVGAFLVTRDGQRYSFWPKLFPRRAIQMFLALGEVRDS
ncbi:hypothetical protein [Novosphingobium sp.]|uniref:hypothetical protein n=1 Tax=Novosphingobium sp. TaxID=1874826 RepID=UPI002FD9280F